MANWSKDKSDAFIIETLAAVGCEWGWYGLEALLAMDRTAVLMHHGWAAYGRNNDSCVEPCIWSNRLNSLKWLGSNGPFPVRYQHYALVNGTDEAVKIVCGEPKQAIPVECHDAHRYDHGWLQPPDVVCARLRLYLTDEGWHLVMTRCPKMPWTAKVGVGGKVVGGTWAIWWDQLGGV